jgi:hypothetical protein
MISFSLGFMAQEESIVAAIRAIVPKDNVFIMVCFLMVNLLAKEKGEGRIIQTIDYPTLWLDYPISALI